MVSILVLVAPGTIKSSHACSWVLLLLAQACQSSRAPGKAHKGMVYGVTSTHCCKLSSSWVSSLLFSHGKFLQVQSCAIVRVFSVELYDIMPSFWNVLFAFSFFTGNIASYLNIHGMKFLVMMIVVHITNWLNQKCMSCLATLIYQQNLAL